MTILSTKILNESQRELLLNTGIGLVEYNAITINFKPFKVPKVIKNAIFTSQNSVLSIEHKALNIEHCFCVGSKTAQALKHLKYNVVEVSENASTLGQLIVEKYSNKKFTFFCGNYRRQELPTLLKANNVNFNEIEAYTTTYNKKTFQRNFDAVLFYSPSGVTSFNTTNTTTTAICIGKTTAQEAKQYTNQVEIANSTLVESVIAKAVNVLTKNKTP